MEQKRMPIFAERFAQLRGEMTQAEFAEFLGISRPTVGFYENGVRLPDALLLCQIAEKCNGQCSVFKSPRRDNGATPGIPPLVSRATPKEWGPLAGCRLCICEG